MGGPGSAGRARKRGAWLPEREGAIWADSSPVRGQRPSQHLSVTPCGDPRPQHDFQAIPTPVWRRPRWPRRAPDLTHPPVGVRTSKPAETFDEILPEANGR